MAKFTEKVADALAQYKSPRHAAQAVYKLCREEAEREGQKPDIEVAIRTPEQNKKHGYNKCWAVSWEAGPYEWAVEASCMKRSKVYAEPHYSFDLQFYG